MGFPLIAACGLAQLFFLDSAPAMPFDPGGSVGVYGADWLSGSFGSLGETRGDVVDVSGWDLVGF
ncbi:MAG: hypothetical protein Ct9H300mP13_7380 [Gammaproteobacteria bacterium]|nr:MAG: hypothetical protein Ct9H300mP13_7380 [Gammaproteobacteria bacterium]